MNILRSTSAVRVVTSITFSVLCVLGLTLDPLRVEGAENEPTLADQAVVAKYRAARLLRDNYIATSTIKNSEKTIKAAPARIKKEQAAVKNAKAVKDATDKVLSEKETAVKAAQEKAKGTDDANLKAALTQATRARDQAKKEAARKKYEFDRAQAKLKSETDRLEKAKEDKTASEKAIPENEAAAKEANKLYAKLRDQAIALERQRVAMQQPSAISDKIDEFIERRLVEAKIPFHR